MITLAIIVGIVVIASAYFIWKRQKLASTLPPGPPAWPLIGNMFQIDQDDPRKTYVEWHKKYGPIFTVWMGSTPNVFVTGYDLMQELFVKRGDEFAERPKSFMFEMFTNGTYGIVNIMGDMWKEQRRFSLHTLRNFGFGRKVMEEKIIEETTKFLDALDEQFRDKSSAVVNVRQQLYLCINNIISSLMVSRTYSLNDPDYDLLKNNLDKIVELMGGAPLQCVDNFPFLRFVPLFNHFNYDDMKDSVEKFYDPIKRSMAERKKNFNPNEEPTDFASAYWKEMKRRQDEGEHPGYFEEWQLVTIIGDIWSAAIETTVTTLSWSMLLMMHNPEVQKRVQREIDTVVGIERSPELSDKSQLPYTMAVINEIQRHANVIISNVPHTVGKDTQVLSYTIPKGVIVLPQIAVPHHDDTLYQDPLTFNPDRFLDNKESKQEQYLMPFSLGKRICLGESLARMELFLVFTALMQKFNFDFVTGETKPSMNPKIGFTAAPHAYRTEIRRRTPLIDAIY